jgi:hypothetical protein
VIAPQRAKQAALVPNLRDPTNPIAVNFKVYLLNSNHSGSTTFEPSYFSPTRSTTFVPLKNKNRDSGQLLQASMTGTTTASSSNIIADDFDKYFKDLPDVEKLHDLFQIYVKFFFLRFVFLFDLWI